MGELLGSPVPVSENHKSSECPLLTLDVKRHATRAGRESDSLLFPFELPGPRYVDRALDGPLFVEPLPLACNADAGNGINDGLTLEFYDALKNQG